MGPGTVEAVEVTWPGSGTRDVFRDVFRDVERGGLYRLVEGAATSEAFALTVDPSPPQPRAHTGH